MGGRLPRRLAGDTPPRPGGAPPPLTRRRFLGALAAGAAVAAGCSDDGSPPDGDPPPSAPPPPGESPSPAVEPSPVFSLGVASGDPLADSVILWTRLDPDELAAGTDPAAHIAVRWEVAADEAFVDVLVAGTATATAALAHSVHVDVSGLAPDRWYWYRSSVGEERSTVGRTRTTPPEGSSPERLRFAVASCQSWSAGYYHAHAHLAAEDLDLVIFVGDYIYEESDDDGPRRYEVPEPTDLDG